MVQPINFNKDDFEKRIASYLTFGSELKFISKIDGKEIEDLGFLISASENYVLIAQSKIGENEFSAITSIYLKNVTQYYIYNIPEKRQDKDHNLFMDV
ncbi:MAG: hypothetical protein WC413_01750 [Candidatus Nanoarchaeia archaeon]